MNRARKQCGHHRSHVWIEALEGRRLLSADLTGAVASRAAPFVDLTAQITSSPTGTITIGGKHQKPSSVKIKVLNNGNVTAKGLLSLNLYGSIDKTLDQTDVLLFASPLKKVNIPANKSKTIRLSGKLPATVPSGTFFVLVDVNPQGKITESDTSNNVASAASAVTINNPAIPPGPRLSGGLTTNNSTVIVGHSDLMHFNVTVAGATSSTAVEVDEFDSSGTLIGKLLDLSDSGSPINADALAKDGVYSGITTVGFNAPGQRYFAAKVTDPTLSTPQQTATLSIAGANPLSQAQLQADQTDFDNVSKVADSVKAAGGSAQAQLDAVSTALHSDSNVVQSSITIANGIIDWQDTDGIEQMVDTTFNPDTAGGGGATPAHPVVHAASHRLHVRQAPAVVPLAAPSADPSKQAIVLSPFAWQFGSFDPGNLISQALRAKGYTVNYKPNTSQADGKVSVADYENLGQYGAIVICAHGMVVRDTVVINTGDPVSNINSVFYAEELGTRQLILNTIPGVGQFYVLRPSFIQDHTGPIDGSVVYLNTCFGTSNRTMADAFLGAGAAVVIGYSNTVSEVFAYTHGIRTFNTLLQDSNNTVGDIPGINSDRDTLFGSNAQFQAIFNLKATLPQPNLLKNTELSIQYSWPQYKSDLDTNTTFLGNTAGYNLPGGPYLTWLGDNTSAGGSEFVSIDLYQAWLDGKWSGSTTVNYGADWYTPAGGSDKAFVTISLEDKNTLDFLNVIQKQISPGQETTGSTTVAGTLTVTLSGDPTNPTVSIQ